MVKVKKRSKKSKPGDVVDWVDRVTNPETVAKEPEEVEMPESMYAKKPDTYTLYGMSENLSAMCDEALEDISALSGVLARGSFVVESAELPDNMIDRLGVVEKKLGEIISAIREVSQVVGR